MGLSEIKNKEIKIAVNNMGAELRSIRAADDDKEILWQGDPKYFSGRSPLLFPIVGGLKDDCYAYDGKRYSLKIHGFARDSIFELVEKSDRVLNYRLSYNEETLKRFPFKFELYQKYEIDGAAINISYAVKNIDSKEMFFSIGAHPAFNCPICENERMDDYFLEFENDESMESYYKIGSDVSLDTRKIGPEGRILNLSHQLFHKGPLIFKRLKSNYIELKSKKSSKTVRVEFAGFPYLGVWSCANDGPFVCIEPWYGLGYVAGSSDNIEEKEGIMAIKPNGTFEAGYVIKIS